MLECQAAATIAENEEKQQQKSGKIRKFENVEILSIKEFEKGRKNQRICNGGEPGNLKRG